MSEDTIYQIIISEKAKRMLGIHIRFIAQVSRTATQKKKNELLSAIHSLSTMPQRFPFLEAEYIPSNKYHQMPVQKWYLILYQIKDNIVYVDYILDCRQDYTWLLD